MAKKKSSKRARDTVMEVNLPALKQMVRQTNAIVQMRQALHEALPKGWHSYPNAAEVDALLEEAGLFEEGGE